MKRALFILSLSVLAMIFFFQDDEAPQKMILEESAKSSALTPTQASPILTDHKEDQTLAVELEESMEDLVTMDDLRDLDAEEVHEAPDVLLEAGALIGSLEERARKTPARQKATLEFFSECAESDEVAAAIRAVCYNKVLTLIPEWDVFLPVSELKVPSDIQLMASKLN